MRLLVYFLKAPTFTVHCKKKVSLFNIMPRKSKGKFKPNKNGRIFPNYGMSEVFRNSSAVSDDTDPVESLKYMKEIFRNKIEDDVITMIFSECSYDVNQTLETLTSLCNDGEVDCLPKDDGTCNKNSYVETSVPEDTLQFSMSETTSNHNILKFQSKSKLAINFPSTSGSSCHSPGQNFSHEIFGSDLQSFPSQCSKNSSLSSNYALNTSDNISVTGSSSSEYECPNGFKKNIPPAYYFVSPDNNNSIVNASSSSPYVKPVSEHTRHQFISPVLPMPMYRFPSPQKSPNMEGSTFRNISRNFHFSPSATSNSKNDQKKQSEIAKATEKILSGSRILVILRGLPGSGKSSLAAKLKFSGEVFSTDDFFIENGEYVYDPYKLNEAHTWNKQRTKEALEKGITPIIIDNTNVEVWEMSPYVLMAKRYNYEIIILEPDTPWKFNVRVLSSKNKHKVSRSKIAKMKERYQHNITVERILKSCNLFNSKNNENISFKDIFNKRSENNPEKFKNSMDFKINNHICQADIHQEEISNDNALYSEASFQNSSALDQLNTNFCLSFDNESVNSSDGYEIKNNDMELNTEYSYPAYNSVTTQSISIHDLDDLKALVREDSEESQSHQSSATGSFQDVSCWEAITEHDDDFLWTTSEQGEYNISNKSRDLENLSLKNAADIQSSDDDIYHNEINKAEKKTTADNLSTNIYFKSQSSFIKSDNSLEKLMTSDKAVENNSNSSACIDKTDIPLFEKNKSSEINSVFLTMNNDFEEKLWIENNSLECEIKNSQLIGQEYAALNKENKLSRSFECLTVNGEVGLNNENNAISISKSMPQLIDNSNKLFKEQYYAIPSMCTAFHVPKFGNAELTSSESVSSNEENKLNNLTEFAVKEEGTSNTKPKPQRTNKKHIVNLYEEYFRSPNRCESFDSENHNHHLPVLKVCDEDDKSEDLLENEETDFSKESINLTKPKPQRVSSNPIAKLNEESFENITVSGVISFIDADNDLDWNISDKETERSSVESLAKVKEEIPIIPKPQRGVSESKSSISSHRSGTPGRLAKKSFLNISVDSIDSDWKMPDYYTGDIPETRSPVKMASPVKITVHSQTEPKDFIFIKSISNGDNYINSNYKVLNADLTNHLHLISDSKLFAANSEANIYSKIATFDKSTSTDDMVEDIEISQKLSHLCECFPDISVEDLHHLLEICHNDETWLSNLLLEWGYKYNVQAENMSNVEEISDGKIVSACNSYDRKNKAEVDEGDIISNMCEMKNSQENTQLREDDIDQNLSEIDLSLTLDQTEVAEEKTKTLFSENSSSSKKLHLILNSAFARQLEELFGPVANSNSKADRCIEIDLEFAQLLHTKWKDTASRDKKTSENDEDVKVRNVAYLKKEGREDTKELLFTKKDPNEPLSLAEIMDMEYALQLHREEKLQKDTNFATKLKRQELYNMYPGADTIALDEIFESNNFSLKDSIFALGEDIDQHDMVQKKQSVENMDECLVKWSESDIFQEFENGDYSDWVYKEEDTGSIVESTIPVASSILPPKAAELRELAVKHYKLRQQYISKAQAAYCRGAKDVASFYAQRGSEYGELFKDANKRASAMIAQQRSLSTSSRVLDLHGLYVQEAIPMLEKFLRDKKLDLQKRQVSSPLTVSIITGKGLHSARGPKLRPSVYEYLKKTGYRLFQ